MLRFRLRQLHVPSLGRYLLPLPKLSDRQLKALSGNLEGRGFSLGRGGGPGRLAVKKGEQRIAIDGALGLASSSGDMLDALGPAIPSLLASRRSDDRPAPDVGALYLSLKRSGRSAQLQLFPRMESLRTWTCLREDGLCGLTPDEAAVLSHLLAGVPASSRLDCVTSKPRDGSKPLRVGRRLYYRSSVTARDFLSSLGTIDSPEPAAFLPKDSLMMLPGTKIDAHIAPEELGEWCPVSPSPRRL